MSEPHRLATPPPAHDEAADPGGLVDVDHRRPGLSRGVARRQRQGPQPGAPRCPEARRLLALAVIPPLAVSSLASAIIWYLLHTTDRGAPLPWSLPAAALVLAAAVVSGAGLVANGESRARAARLAVLRRQLAQNRVALRDLAVRAADGDLLDAPRSRVPRDTGAVSGGDPLDQLARDVAATRHTAEVAVAEAVASVRDRVRGGEEKVQVFATLALRLQSLVHRELAQLDRLERDIEDPDLLSGLFQLDHLATRVRRHAENLAVLGGAVTRRQWSRPVALSEVLRSAGAEVHHYPRIKLVPPFEGRIKGRAVADVTHLLAELLENATEFSAPETEVLLRVQPVAAGVAIEVEDRGSGIPAAEQERINDLLAGTSPTGGIEHVRGGRVGFFVVAALARRHDIAVRLRGNIYGGVQAVLVLPPAILGEGPAVAPADGGTAPDGAGDEPVPASVPQLPPLPAHPASATGHGHPYPADLAPRTAGGGDRPTLPRRRRQEHLVPQLRETPLGGPGPEEESWAAHDPGLMAAFRHGASLVEDPAHAVPGREL